MTATVLTYKRYNPNQLVQRGKRTMAQRLLCGILFLGLLGCGCVRSDTHQPATSHTKKELPSETAKMDLEPSSTKEVYFVEGCEIPMPEDRRVQDRVSIDRVSATGVAVAVTSTVYKPIGDFLFTRKSFVVPEEDRVVPTGQYRLIWIEELTVNERVFGYNIFTEPIPDQADAANGEAHIHKNTYTCFDSNGDGKFEYVINMSDTPPKVPVWVME